MTGVKETAEPSAPEKAPVKKPKPPSHPLAAKLSIVPKRPGVYLFKGAGERVLYVGKAKALRPRLSSYFQKSAALDQRKAAMVRRVRDFSYIVTDTELEALALEANLIKQHRPQYNVILRDDKNYPYIKITVQEEWPRIEVVRRIKKDGSLYFGPYVPTGGMWEALALIRRHFGIRTCKHTLEKPMRPCMQHGMGRCPAPCAGMISKGEYLRAIDEAVLFLKGRNTELVQELEGKMARASEEMRYEYAAVLRDRIEALKRAFESQKVIAPELGDIDVIGFVRDGADAVFQVFFVKGGIMIGAKDFHLKDTGGIPDRELLHGFIEIFYSKELMPSEAVLVRVRPEGADNLGRWLSDKRGGGVRFVLPREKKRAELLKMAEENARLSLAAKKGRGEGAILKELARRLGLPRTPESIGAFDISNISGSEAVGSFVYWDGGGFRGDLYRHLKIKGVEGVDDYAMMQEAVGRTLKYEEVSPDLVVIDGGKGHLEAGLEALDGLPPDARRPMVISVAKDPDRAFMPGVEEPVGLDDRSPSSLLLRRIRDEAHRFAITFHRRLRGKRTLESPLLRVPGIRKKRHLALLKRFGSIEAIRRATVEEIASVPGMNRPAAEAVKRAL